MYKRQAYVPPAYPGPLATQVDIAFGDEMRLAGYEVESSTLRPGDRVRVRLEWQARRPMARDWSVFVHLNDPVLGRPIAQRDMFPGQGLLATRLLSPGERLINEYVLTVPPTAVAPAELALVVGLYDYGTGERLIADVTADGRPPTADGAQTTDAVTLATVPLSPRAGEYPNPVSILFEHGLELVGFAVEPRRVAAGEGLELRTIWRPSAPLPADFTLFALSLIHIFARPLRSRRAGRPCRRNVDRDRATARARRCAPTSRGRRCAAGCRAAPRC